MSFQQAAIKIEKTQEFAKLQPAVEQVFLRETVERFLKQLERKEFAFGTSMRCWRSECSKGSASRD